MTLPSSPPITLEQIKTEFGGPGNLLSYYAGGSYVSSGTANGTGHAIPSSGVISFGNFLGSSNTYAGLVNTYNGLVATNSTGIEVAPAGATKVLIEIWGAGGGGYWGTAIGDGGGGAAYANVGPFLLSSANSFTWSLGGSGKGSTTINTSGHSGNVSSVIDTSTGGNYINIDNGEGGGAGSGGGSGGFGGSFTKSSTVPSANVVNGTYGYDYTGGAKAYYGGESAGPTGSTGGAAGGAAALSGTGGSGSLGSGGGSGTTGGGNGGPARIRFTYT